MEQSSQEAPKPERKAAPSWPKPAWYYLGVVVAAGWSVLGWAAVALLSAPLDKPTLLFLPLALVLASQTTVQLPQLHGRISPTGLIVLYATLNEGLAVGLVLAGLEGLFSSLKQSQHHLRRLLFNIGVLPLAVWLAYGTLQFLPTFGDGLVGLVARALALASLYYLFNMTLVLGIVVTTAGKQALAHVRSALLWSWAEYLISGLVAGLLSGHGQSISLPLMLGMFIIWLTHLTLQHYFKVLEAKEEALTHNHRLLSEKESLLKEKETALQENHALLSDKESLLEELGATHLASLETLALTIEAKDPLTAGHVRRVQALADQLALALALEAEVKEALHIAALLHDIGKLAIPEYVLFQDRKQTPADLARYQRHASLGADILRASRMESVVPMVRHHHEYLDGSGYPDGLVGECIPLGARVLSVADAYDKLRFPRTGEGLAHGPACDQIRLDSGRLYDPLIVDALLGLELPLERIPATEVTPVLAGEVHESDPRQSLIEDLQSHHAEAMTLHTLDRVLRDTLDPQVVLRHMAEAIEQIVPFAAVAIFTPEEPEGRLVGVWQRGELSELQLQDTLKAVARFSKPLKELTVFDPFGEGEREGAERSGLGGGSYKAFTAFPLPMQHLGTGLVVLYQAVPAWYTDIQRRLVQLVLEHAAPTLLNAQAYDRFQRQSTLDELTGLSNARALRAQGPHALAASLLTGHPTAVVMMDLNGFKAVNDTLGHHEGDRLLVEVARILRRHAQPEDLLVRNGGDEFVMCAVGLTAEQVQARLGRIYADACAIWPLRAENVSIGTSFGVAFSGHDGQTLEQLMQTADTRMYDDKRRKHGMRRNEAVRIEPAAPAPASVEAAGSDAGLALESVAEVQSA